MSYAQSCIWIWILVLHYTRSIVCKSYENSDIFIYTTDLFYYLWFTWSPMVVELPFQDVLSIYITIYAFNDDLIHELTNMHAQYWNICVMSQYNKHYRNLSTISLNGSTWSISTKMSRKHGSTFTFLWRGDYGVI